MRNNASEPLDLARVGRVFLAKREFALRYNSRDDRDRLRPDRTRLRDEPGGGNVATIDFWKIHAWPIYKLPKD
jgi:hypothetical protein